LTYAYALTLRFNDKDQELIQAFLYENEISTFQEGEMAEDADGNVVLINEDSLIRIFSEERGELENISHALKNQFPEILSSISEINSNFNDAWKEFSKPIIVSDRILIQPSWLEFEERREIEIILDPGLAFGAGSHETTLLCMRKLEELIATNKIDSLLDVGCGSGILSILGSKLGVKKVTGIDNDEQAISSSIENANRNEIHNTEFSTGLLSDLEGTYDLVVANIISSVLDTLMKDIKEKVKPGGILVLSGLLKDEVEEFKVRHGLEGLEVEELGEWVVVWG
jgi:ribosomal protein L11 methyltransferase